MKTLSLLLFGVAVTTLAAPVERPRLRAASLEFGITPVAGGPTSSKTGAVVQKVAGPLKTAVTLLEDGDLRVCLITPHMNSPKGANISPLIRRSVAEALNLPASHVLLMVSHNHTDLNLVSNHIETYSTLTMAPVEIPEPKLLPAGHDFLNQLVATAKRLPSLLQPVTVWWAEGSEGRISYNRKGRRADGSTYLMREEDRDLMGVDFNGDIDRQAPIVVLKNARGEPVTALTQFTSHPCSCFHPEKPVVFGDWPQVACDHVAVHLSPSKPIAVSFLQGCAGDVNSKGMFRGDVALSKKYGRMLADSYIKALENLTPSRRDGLNYSVEKVRIPLGPLPSEKVLKAEIAEMEDFIRRANAGDENTLLCVGQNFPRELTPAYRGKLIEMVLPWSKWALNLRQTGKADTVAKFLEVEIQVFRLGDVGIVGMPFEPFQGIGRQIRAGSKLPFTIPCGYANVSYGYLTDGPNTGDGEYQSAHYRYSKFRPPFQKPAGDVVAIKAVEILNRFAKKEDGKSAAPPLVSRRFIAIGNVCAWPNLTQLRDGSIIATIFNQPTHGGWEGDVECWGSCDGQLWEKRGTPAPHEPGSNRMNVATGLARDGSLLVLAAGWTDRPSPGTYRNPHEGHLLPVWICRSGDGGRTWMRSESPVALLPDSPKPIVPFGDIVQLADGTLGVCIYGSRRTNFYVSRDDGRTWAVRGIVRDNNINETTLVVLPGGRLLAAGRTSDDQHLDLFTSDDHGATWKFRGAVTEKSQIPADVMLLADGRLLLTYGSRVPEKLGVEAKISADGGVTWSAPISLVADISGDIGYPSNVQLTGGEIVTAYYARHVASHHRYHMGVVIWNAPQPLKQSVSNTAPHQP